MLMMCRTWQHSEYPRTSLQDTPDRMKLVVMEVSLGVGRRVADNPPTKPEHPGTSLSAFVTTLGLRRFF
jgi:hypothetical protein